MKRTVKQFPFRLALAGALFLAIMASIVLLVVAPVSQMQGGNRNDRPRPSPTGRRTPTAGRSPRPRPTPVVRAPQIEMVSIQGGTFDMGSPVGEVGRYENEGPVHKVTLSSFQLGKYEVTQAQWRTVMGSNPSKFQNCDRCPVEQVSWNDVQEFISKLNGLDDKYIYRLPTEAEWEYAARSGTTTPFAFGASISSTLANFDGNYPYGGASMGENLQKTMPVGSYRPNAWGLFDMHGNVWEWCRDFYESTYYVKSPAINPKGPGAATTRVLRGGSWNLHAKSLRSAYRYLYPPDQRDFEVGFRLAADLRAP